MREYGAARRSRPPQRHARRAGPCLSASLRVAASAAYRGSSGRWKRHVQIRTPTQCAKRNACQTPRFSFSCQSISPLLSPTSRLNRGRVTVLTRPFHLEWWRVLCRADSGEARRTPHTQCIQCTQKYFTRAACSGQAFCTFAFPGTVIYGARRRKM